MPQVNQNILWRCVPCQSLGCVHCATSFKPHSDGSEGSHFLTDYMERRWRNESLPHTQAGFHPSQTCLSKCQGLVTQIGPKQTRQRRKLGVGRCWQQQEAFFPNRNYAESHRLILSLCPPTFHSDDAQRRPGSHGDAHRWSTSKDHYVQAALVSGTQLVLA